MKISAANLVYGKYAWLLIAVIGNTCLYLNRGQFIGWGEFLAFNAGSLFTAGIVSIYAFRLWDASISGRTVRVCRNNTAIEFDISEIKNIEAVPNLLTRRMPPFIEIILKEPVDGMSKFKFLPSWKRLDETMLIQPWRELYRERAKESMKRRGARR